MELIKKTIKKVLASKSLYVVKSLSYYESKKNKLPINFDYIRHRTLELCALEVENNKVIGSIAELGVYKGDFARLLNLLFSQRVLYLFDTFEGFDENELKQDEKLFKTQNQDFTDTSVEYVLSQMPYPSQCVVKKGLFPATTENINDTFAFVSIDTDLFEPVYNGLCYFYPRLENKGYIFVHDFNNSEYLGAKDAVERFCREYNVSYVPIPDTCGTVIITK